MNIRPLLIPLAAMALSACVPVVIAGVAAGGAATGVAAEREGGLGSKGTDIRIRAAINDKWFHYNTETFRKLHLTVDEGRVLVTGIVQNPDDRVAAVRLVWQVDGVDQVINEIQVADAQSFGSYAQDKWISTRIRTELTFAKDVTSPNYTIDTVNGVVYLMGIYVDKAELDEVVDIARQTPHVKQVVSYVKKQGEPIPVAGARHAGTPGAPSTAIVPPSNGHNMPAPPIDDSLGDSGDESGAAAAPPEKLDGVQSESLPSPSLQPQTVQKEELH